MLKEGKREKRSAQRAEHKGQSDGGRKEHSAKRKQNAASSGQTKLRKVLSEECGVIKEEKLD